MAYSAPPNFVAGAVLTEAQLDILSDDIVFLANPPKVRAYNSAAISITNATSTALTSNSERFDTDTMHSTATNTGRITFTTAGTYAIVGHASWASAAGNLRELTVRAGGATQIAAQRAAPIGAGFGSELSIATQYDFTAGQYVELMAYQDSGAAINVATCAFAAVWVSL